MPYTPPVGGTTASPPKPGPKPHPAPIHSWRQPVGGVRPVAK